MIAKDIRKHLKENLAIYKRQMGLEAWAIRVIVKSKLRKESDKQKHIYTMADCVALPEYRSAVIRLFADNISEAELVETIKHELCHCVLSPFRILTDAISLAYTDDSISAMLHNLNNYVEELIVLNIEALMKAQETHYGKNTL